ncbi:cell wall hydrolase [Exiguobacterium sp. s140]|uniref:cell wall hydrolase n=1 Tax=Exiguobacterium sp. s140 TaxID=2751290 RepID=UPI001BE78424|nr:cell wall hydrolase [Exiguobacterium sp. s140]
MPIIMKMRNKVLSTAFVLSLIVSNDTGVAYESVLDGHAQETDLVQEVSELFYQAPESLPLTHEAKKKLQAQYVDKYMPKEGCALVEELPKTSDIHYTPPKPKPKPKAMSAVAQTTKNAKATAIQKTSLTKKTKLPASGEGSSVNGKSISMTAEERLWLEKLVEAESGGEPYEGRLAVATIIANRIEMKEFPNTVMAVITAPKQFSPFMDGSIHKKQPSPDTKRAVAEVFDNGVRTLGRDAAYFCTVAIAPNSWIGQNKTLIKQIGNHAFFEK